MRLGGRRRARARRLPFLFLMLVAGIAVLGWLVERRVEPVLMYLAETKASVLATDIINETINERVVKGVDLKELVLFEKNQAGDVSLIRINAVEVNRIETLALSTVQNAIKMMGEQQIEIPIGQLLGSRLFAAIGPRLRVRVLPAGRATAAVTDRFESAGVNQVKHCVYLETEVTLRVVAPLASSEIKLKNISPLTVVIVPGKVPTTYIDISR